MNETTLLNAKSVLASENKLLNAMKNCNIKALENLLHKDLLFNIPSGQTISKEMDIESYRSSNMRIVEIESSQQIINLIGDNAVVSVTIKMKGKYLDNSIDGKYRLIRVWKLYDKVWKVIAGSSIGPIN
ncbi:MAG: nuclear transport factor 2 family protein [Proteobacteria bacterium]|nr:nuclear transport factor 2 family protein [Pseudomonadota bacterium]